MKILQRFSVLIKFSRVHTIIGTFVGSLAIFFIVIGGIENLSLTRTIVYMRYLIVALSLNLFVVGLNQIYDYEIDLVNKPFLPLAANKLNIHSAWIIILTSMVVSILFSITNTVLILTTIVIGIIGVLYSVPPFRARNHFTFASVLIVLGRGILLNLTAFLYFRKAIFNQFALGYNILSIVVITSLFAFVISIFKDLPDISGDNEFKIKTIPIIWGINKSFRFLISILLLTFIIAGYFAYTIIGSVVHPFVVYHYLVSFGLITSFFKTDTIVNNQNTLKKLYKLIWGFFYIQYVILILILV